MLGKGYESYALANSEDIDAFTSPSKSFNTYLMSVYNIDSRKMFEVRDAVEPEVIEFSRKYEQIEEVDRIARKIPSSVNTIAYVGSITAYHSFHDLLKAFIIAKKFLNHNLKMLLITSNQFSTSGNSDLIVLNNIPRKFIPCILRRATALILPHRAGTQFDFIPSNKIYDYMLAGRPIVAYRTPAVDETLKNYSMYISVKPNDPIELAKGIVKAIELYSKSEPRPVLDNIPTLNEVARLLREHI